MYSILLSKMEIGFPIVEKRLKKIIKKNSKVIIIPWSFPNETDKIGLNEYYDKKIKPKYEKILIDFGIDKKNK